MTAERVIRIIVKVCVGLLIVALAAYPMDWLVWRTRVAMGGGMDSLQVNNYTVAELKGNKEDYYVEGTSTVSCSKSLFPEAGSGACWWVRRHAEVITRY